MTSSSGPAESDLEAVGRQLGRPARDVHAVAHRCPCGLPDVVATQPRLHDGTPFPTTFYLTCPRAASRIGSLEGSGLMKEMEARLGTDPDLAAAYAGAHESYLAARAELGSVPRSRASPPAACPTGSSACTCWRPSPSPRAAA